MVSVETLGSLERRLNASIPQQQLQGEVEARLKRIGRTAKIHGFRPGKVPFKVIEQQYGAQVQQEVLSDVLRRSFVEAAEANSLKVAGNPNFEPSTAAMLAAMPYVDVFAAAHNAASLSLSLSGGFLHPLSGPDLSLAAGGRSTGGAGPLGRGTSAQDRAGRRFSGPLAKATGGTVLAPPLGPRARGDDRRR